MEMQLHSALKFTLAYVDWNHHQQSLSLVIVKISASKTLIVKNVKHMRLEMDFVKIIHVQQVTLTWVALTMVTNTGAM